MRIITRILLCSLIFPLLTLSCNLGDTNQPNQELPTNQTDGKTNSSENYPSKPSQSEKESIQEGMDITIILFVFIFILLCILSFPLYKYIHNLNKLVSRKLKKEQLISIPEDFYDLNNDLKIEIKDYNKKILDVLNNFNIKMSEIEERLGLYHQHIDNKEIELQKYRNGILNENFKNSIQNLIDAYEQSKSLYDLMKKSNDDSKFISDIEAVYRLLRQTIENGGIETYSPKINSNYIKDEYIDETNYFIETDKKNLQNKIAEIIQPAYFIASSGKVIRKSKVKIYKLK